MEIYKKLARHLDNLPGGFPSTDSGVELRILRRLFQPDEAEMALHLNLIPEKSSVIARRAGIGTDKAAKRLRDMSRKGLIFSIEIGDRPPLYTASQYVVGIWEYHVNRLDPELIRDMNEYIPAFSRIMNDAPQLRTIPVGRSISAQMEVLPYEEAEKLARGRKRYLVAPCICRREHRIIGNGCDKPEESCLVFGLAADYYERAGIGRVIDLDETLDILQKADAAGLVLQPSNAQKIVNICCCCGCCCQILKNLKRYPKPAHLAVSPFIASAAPETCKGCGVCVERCQMDALRLENERVLLDSDRCIGCGLCVSTCPTHSLTLVRKPEPEQIELPRNMSEAMLTRSRIRGKPSGFSLAMMRLRSKLDRFLALR